MSYWDPEVEENMPSRINNTDAETDAAIAEQERENEFNIFRDRHDCRDLAEEDY